jgi:hypothetical protein
LDCGFRIPNPRFASTKWRSPSPAVGHRAVSAPIILRPMRKF